MCCCISLWVYPVWDCLGFLDLGAISFPIVGEFSAIISSHIFSYPLFLFFWNANNLNFGAFIIVPEVSETVLYSYISFSAPQQLFLLFCLPAHLFILLPQLFYY